MICVYLFGKASPQFSLYQGEEWEFSILGKAVELLYTYYYGGQ